MGYLWLLLVVGFTGAVLVSVVRIYFDFGDYRIKKKFEEERKAKQKKIE